MPRLFIAEKPSVARAIADGLPGSVQRKDTHFVVGNDAVIWLYGHVLRLAEPEDYDERYKRWNPDHLPIVPAVWKMIPSEFGDAARQVRTIASLGKSFDVIVNAGDPDREGQLLVDEVLDYVGLFKSSSKTFLRILPNATDAASIQRALKKIESNDKYRSLYHAGMGRSYSDWLLGMNLTRAVTTLLVQGKGVASVGRVQTPTLGLVVRRDETIENFVARNFYNLALTVSTVAGNITLTFEPKDEDKRIWDAEVAKKAIEGAIGQSIALGVEVKEKSQRPLDLYTLPTLQKDCSKLWKWGATKTLEVAQSLYEAKVLSYPRTECPYLPTEQKAEVPTIIDLALNTGSFVTAGKMRHLMKPREAVFDSAKVAEHHAMVPTTQAPNFDKLSPDQRNLWILVTRRYLMMLLPDYRYQETIVTALRNNIPFTARGTIPLNREESWLAVFTTKTDSNLLPPITDGMQGQVTDAKVTRGKTSPPDRYTEGTLITDMGAVAKYVDDPKLKATLKETSGIGTAATQANTIDILKSRSYVEINAKGEIISTAFGRALIKGLPPALYDPGLTAIIEDALKTVQAGEITLDSFMQRTAAYVGKRVEDIRRLKGVVRLTVPENQGKPSAGKKGSGARTGKPPARANGKRAPSAARKSA